MKWLYHYTGLPFYTGSSDTKLNLRFGFNYGITCFISSTQGRMWQDYSYLNCRMGWYELTSLLDSEHFVKGPIELTVFFLSSMYCIIYGYNTHTCTEARWEYFDEHWAGVQRLSLTCCWVKLLLCIYLFNTLLWRSVRWKVLYSRCLLYCNQSI